MRETGFRTFGKSKDSRPDLPQIVVGMAAIRARMVGLLEEKIADSDKLSRDKRAELRIRAHVLLCRLALLLIRIAETGTGQTWTMLREELQRLHLGTFTVPAGVFRQRTELTSQYIRCRSPGDD